MKRSALVLLLGLTFVAGGSGVASATPMPVTGTYTTGGNTTGTGPWTLTSTDATFSILRFVFDSPVTFGSLTDINIDYDAVQGGIAAGSPRVAVVTDSDFDNIADGSFLIHWGPAGSFADPTLGPGNTGNLLALTDLGRYDLTSVGGNFYTDRAEALSIASSYNVLRLSIILDSFGGNDREFIIPENAFDVTTEVPESVPEPTSLMLLGSGVVACVARARRRLKK